MFHRLFGPFVVGRAALGLLVIRLVFGAALALHGLPKIQKPFSWMPPESPVPGFLQALAALSEFGGGLALIVGLLTPLACLGILCTMATAYYLVHLPAQNPFVSNNPTQPAFELAAAFFAVALGLLISGPGVLSLDALLFGRRPTDRYRH